MADSLTRIFQYKQQFDAARKHPRTIDHHKRLDRNHRMYAGINGGQWLKSDEIEAKAADRIRLTLNLIMPNVEHLVGDLMSNPHSVEFVTDDSATSADSDLIKQCFDADYNLGKYESAIAQHTRDSLIHTGVLHLYPNFRYSDKGNIGLRRLPPQNVILDPYWQTDDIADCAKIWNAPWMGIEQIRDLCRANKVRSEAVEEAWKRIQERGVDTQDAPSYRDITSDYYNVASQQFRVVECYYMSHETVSKVIRRDTRTGKGGAVASYSNPDLASRDLAFRLKDQMNHQNSIMYSVIEDTVPVCRLFTIVPGLDDSLVLEDSLAPIQIGRLPFIVSSAHNNQGVRQGVVDAMIDPQIGLNKRESSASEILDKNARGNIWAESDAWGDDKEMERKFRENMNKSGQILKVADGTLQSNKIQLAKTNQPPVELWNAADRMVSFMDKVTGLTAARQGDTKSHDTALMYADQVSQAEIKLFLLNLTLSSALDQLGDMYFFAVKDMYCGEPRAVVNPKNGKSVKLNAWVQLDDGTPVLHNDIASLPRYLVRVEQAKHGITVRKRYLTLYTELLQRVRNPLLAARYEMEQMRYLGLPDDKVAKMEEDCQIFIDFQKIQMISQIAQLKLQTAQADQQTKQLQNPAPVQPQGILGMGGPMQAPAMSPGQGAIPGGAGMAGAQNAIPQ